jgi:hypothetical protein
LEYWSVGVVEYWKIGPIDSSSYHYSSAPILQYSVMPVPNTFEIEHFKNSMKEESHES